MLELNELLELPKTDKVLWVNSLIGHPQPDWSFAAQILGGKERLLLQ